MEENIVMDERDILSLPFVPLRGLVVYPNLVSHIDIGRDTSLAAVDYAMEHDRQLLVATQVDENEDNPGFDDVYTIGCVVKIEQFLRMPGGLVRILVNGISRVRMQGFSQKAGYLEGAAVKVAEVSRNATGEEALRRVILKRLLDWLDKLRDGEEASEIAKSIEEPGVLADYAASQLPLKLVIRQQILEMTDVEARLRRIGKSLLMNDEVPLSVSVKNLEKLLGPVKFLPDTVHKDDEVGIVTGMAWTQVGGEVLETEAVAVKGRGRLMLTGQLGSVMKESAEAGVTYIRSRAEALGLAEDFYTKTDLHIHLPEGAIPKDGPSAGITMATAITSALTGKAVRHDVAMTGEITLRGTVLPVGGIKEKVIAAHRAGIKKILLPEQNRRDMVDVPQSVQDDVKFVFVHHMDEVLAQALVKS